VGCSRKAYLAPSVMVGEDGDGEGRSASVGPEDGVRSERRLPTAVGQGWVVRELLETVNRCLFCGNKFVSLL